jgi:hypothetical protein
MQAVKVSAPFPTERMTWAEICERYPEQYVLLAEVEFESASGPNIVSARVIAHAVSQDEHYAIRRELEPAWAPVYSRFTGEPIPIRYLFRPGSVLCPVVYVDNADRD